MGEHKVWCGVCEASCGLVATVEEGRLVQLGPDPTHPNSTGFACRKGTEFGQVLDDPDRVRAPLRRRADGTFEEVSWDTAFDDIGRRLSGIVAEHGRGSVGVCLGNPIGWNYGAFLLGFGMAAALKTKHFYTAASVDINNHWVVGQLLYGHNLINPFPDLARTDFALIVGANPVVSHGSMMTIGRVRETMLGIVKRGGRVVVVDPRRTETARLFQHLPIRPDGDAWLLAGMVKTILDEDLIDRRAVVGAVRGSAFLRTLVAEVDLDRVETETGIPATTVRHLARDLATAESACVYGRCGASMGRFSTLTKYLVEVLNAITGNLDRPGGVVFGQPMVDAELFTALFRMQGYDRWRSRVDDMPEVFGTSPLASFAREVLTPGEGQLRAFVSVSSNLATTAPNSPEMERALSALDLYVSLDPYVTESNRHAHYVLPPKLLLEREGFPLFSQLHYGVPNAQWTDALVSPPPLARDDWWILDQICKTIDLVPSPAPGAQLLGRLGVRIPPHVGVDAFMRLGPEGDLFGLRRGGISRAGLLRKGRAVKLADACPTGVLRRRLRTKSKRVELAHPIFAEEMTRLLATSPPGSAFPLSLFTIRENRSQNSWLHNVPSLLGSKTARLRIHPADATARGLSTGDEVSIASASGQITALALVTDEVMTGTVGLPPHFGHRGGWRTAVGAGGGRYNDLTPNDRASMDRASGQAWLNGIRVQVAAVRQADDARHAGADALVD